jgi:poly(A) polymerase
MRVLMRPKYKSVKFENKYIDKDALKVVKTIHKAGYEAYFVGGCVRDLLLGLEPKDFDIATSASPEQVNNLFKRSRLVGKRFLIVHVMFSSRKFIEVATFRSGKVQTAKSGVVIRDNSYGEIEDDVLRRDFRINALYYDVVKNRVIDYVDGLIDLDAREIHMIGNPNERFKQDPVRMIRAARFEVKLDAKLSDDIRKSIINQASLLENISPARLYEECIKLFHNTKSLETFDTLERYGLMQHLFKQTKKTDFIDKALLNTSMRIKEGKPVTPVFIFAVFLWQSQNNRFQLINNKKKSSYLAMVQASEEVILAQTKQVSLPRWLTARIKDIWLLQSKLEKMHPKKVQQLLLNPRFRMAYDFLLLRSQSTNPELIEVAKFWTKIQES